jgi:succinate dehydrogenase / fumarate reductase iron-sulfur subunit
MAAKNVASKAENEAEGTAESKAQSKAQSKAERAAADGRKVRLRVLRQDGPDKPDTKRWEEFEVPYLPLMNVNSALQQVQKRPVRRGGPRSRPWCGRPSASKRCAARARW